MQIMRLALCVTLVAGAMFAQTDRGTVTGTVSDPAGAVIAAAVITAREYGHGSQLRNRDHRNGQLYPSHPCLLVRMRYRSARPVSHDLCRRGLRVQVAQTARIDIVLQVGSTTEAVTVNAEAPLLKTESAEQSHTIERDRVNALPLTFAGIRSPIAFAATLPGASIPSGSNLQMRVNGTPNTTYKALVDGQDITSSIDASHLPEMHPSVEALEEMTLQTSNFAAEFGQVAGGLFNLTTRSESR